MGRKDILSIAYLKAAERIAKVLVGDSALYDEQWKAINRKHQMKKDLSKLLQQQPPSQKGSSLIVRKVLGGLYALLILRNHICIFLFLCPVQCLVCFFV